MSPSTLVNDVVAVGPEDVDSAGELAPKVVKEQQAHELITRVRANYPKELVIVEQRDEDRPRTAALDAEEVLEAARAEFGDETQDGGVVAVTSARVRGKQQPLEQKAVCLLWKTPSGRTARGAMGYTPLAKSLEAFDRGVASGEITDVDESDSKDLKRTVERQEDTIRRLRAKLDEGDVPAKVPTGTVPELRKAIPSLSVGELKALIAAEQADATPRKSIVHDVEVELRKRSKSPAGD